MGVVKRAGAALVAALMLLAPALWNGFPLLQYDTGGYIARWFEGTLEVSRSTVYGVFLDLTARPNFWPAVLVQVALTVWVIALVLRAHGFGARPRILLATVLALCVLTALPWVADLLLTDIFAGLSVLALYLLVMRAEALAPWERAALFVLVAIAAASHSATLLVLLALIAAAVLVALVGYTRMRRLQPPLGASLRGLMALALGAVMLVTANYAVSGRIAWTPGGEAIVFGRMLEAGIVTRYLDDHCPDPRLKLCDHRRELPATADEFFWGESVFNRLGRFQGLNDEMRTIVVEALIQYPWLQLKAAVAATAEQLVLVATGYGVHTEIWHTYAMIERFEPATAPAMHAARQQKGELNFAVLNRVHVPIAWASMLLLLAAIGLGIWRERFADLGWLGGAVALAILANAVACGALSNPHDRYGARVAWLATLVLLLVGWRAARAGDTASKGESAKIQRLTRSS